MDSAGRDQRNRAMDDGNDDIQSAGELPDRAGQHERRGGGFEFVSNLLQNAVLSDETIKLADEH